MLCKKDVSLSGIMLITDEEGPLVLEAKHCNTDFAAGGREARLPPVESGQQVIYGDIRMPCGPGRIVLRSRPALCRVSR
jgi:hypothetical protein